MKVQYVSLSPSLPTNDSRTGLPAPTSRLTPEAFRLAMQDKHMPFRVSAQVQTLFEIEDVLRSPLVHSVSEAQDDRWMREGGADESVCEVYVAHRNGVVVFICAPNEKDHS